MVIVIWYFNEFQDLGCNTFLILYIENQLGISFSRSTFTNYISRRTISAFWSNNK